MRVRACVLIILGVIDVACAAKPVAPPAWESKYRDRADCRGTVGTECFEYSKLVGRDPSSVCRAESAYPADPRRSQCYGTFLARDGERLDPDRLGATIVAGGPDRAPALATLFWQASAGDGASAAWLAKLALGDAEIPRRAEALSWLAERGQAAALDGLAARVLDPSFRERREWFPYLARLRGAAVGEKLLRAIESTDVEIRRLGLDYAQRHPDVPPERFWRAALLGARRGDAEDCRRRLREGLQTQPEETRRALAALVQDPAIGTTAGGLLASIRAAGSTADDVRVWATAGRLPSYLPGIEDEDDAAREPKRREAEALEGLALSLGRVVTFDPSAPSRLYVAVQGAQRLRDVRLLAAIEGPNGAVRWLVDEPHALGRRDFCDPLPGKCHYPSWLPEGEYVVFGDARSAPLFPAAGTYAIRFESAYRTFTSGPVLHKAP